jgi:hypothetical protein
MAVDSGHRLIRPNIFIALLSAAHGTRESGVASAFGLQSLHHEFGGGHQMNEANRNTIASGARNPFGVMDVPDPNDAEVVQFAFTTTLKGSADDANAVSWATAANAGQPGSIEGNWSSRWNGASDPTISGDSPDKWKQGRGVVGIVDNRIYFYFEWDAGARKGLIDAQREGTRLVGKYINLTSPAITRPWVGLIVDNRRIDGRFPEGRLDFRR